MRIRTRGAITSASLAAAMITATLAAATAPAQAQSGLPALDIPGVYVTGVSSGGFMATQLQVAYSATIDGAGIVAAGPYDCGQGNVIDFATCDIGASLPALEQQAVTWSNEGQIDPISDPEGAMLTHWLGSVNPPNTGSPEGTPSSFSQNLYAPGGDAPALSMDNDGLLYTPPACAAGAACKLVVALHGCLSGQYLLGDEFPELANLDAYADTNNLVILYPQAIASIIPYNPEGCWTGGATTDRTSRSRAHRRW